MPPSSRILQANHATTSGSSASPPPEPPLAVDSDVVVILAALLCALICVVGLAAVARCAWTRRSGSASSSNPAPPPPNKGLKKKVLESLPKIAFEPSSKTDKLAECAICLAEFAEGEEVRILPQCGHGFHAGCIDTWLGSHSSCPSCRRVLVVPVSRGPQSGKGKCRMCGGSSSAAAAAAEMVVKAREDGQGSTYLP